MGYVSTKWDRSYNRAPPLRYVPLCETRCDIITHMGSEMQVNILPIFSLGTSSVSIRFSCLLYSLCHVRSLMFRKERKERNDLFNDTLNTFYLRLYGVGLTFKFLNYITGNKYNNSLDTREINVVSHS